MESATHSFQGIIPARAGNMIAIMTMMISLWDHPRSRGEYAIQYVSIPKVKGSSPLARGILLRMFPSAIISGIIPARAGNIEQKDSSLPAAGDHPRSRGEYAVASPLYCFSMGSSPLARGISLSGTA